MLAYRIEGIIGESLCKDENDRNAVAEMKHKYANRSEVFNNRFGKNAYIFIADTSEGSITLGAFVTDLQKISAIVDSYAQHMGIQMTDLPEIQELRKLQWQGCWLRLCRITVYFPEDIWWKLEDLIWWENM